MTTTTPNKKTKPTRARLIYAASESCADLLYLGGIFVPDPFLAFVIQNKSYAIVNALEFTRVAHQSKFKKVLPYEPLLQAAQQYFKSLKKAYSRPALVTAYFAKQNKIRAFEIPYNFPAGLATELEDLGLQLHIGPSLFFEDRIIKTEYEAKQIQLANKACAAGFATAERILKESTIKKGYIFYQNKKLTSEVLRAAIDIACLEHGAVAHNTIVASGDQATEPHNIGSGPLHANSFIIVDIFPRLTASGYHGDMTRTFLKGCPSREQVDLIQTVLAAQKHALATLKAGVTGAEVHKQVVEYFSSKGYMTGQKNNNHYGFFHSTGHGLGLEVHELPGLSNTYTTPMKTGMVLTVEPGLYYKGLGGVRIEDVAIVTATGNKLLSKYHYQWHIE